MPYDAIVLGGGLYGCKVAVMLRQFGLKKVLLMEPNDICAGATYANQGRVHGGYHYCRSYSTAMAAQQNYIRFLTEHASAISGNAQHVYAIGRDSKTSPEQFETLCRQIGAPLMPNVFGRGNYFTDLIERSYFAQEVAFDQTRMAALMERQLSLAGVETRWTHGRVEEMGSTGVKVRSLVDGDLISAGYVFNCTYANLNRVGISIATRLKKERTEVALVHIPDRSGLYNTDITVMDGPFWSLMKFPSEKCHALTHVTHTVHSTWFSGEHEEYPTDNTNFQKMIDDVVRYVPSLRGTEYIRSLFTTRVVLAENEDDDGRPVLWEYAADCPRVISILGSKFSAIYDIEDMLKAGEWVR